MKKPNLKNRTSRRGAYSAAASAIAIAVVILINTLAGQLPAGFAQIDLTGNSLYDISDTSRDYLAAMEEDVSILVLADKATVDTRIVRFMETYAALSDRLTLTFTDPVIYPSLLTAYGVESGTVVVECAATGRTETFSLNDIIGYDMMAYYYYGTTQETDFDCEGLLTSAIDFVISAETLSVYTLTGHGEPAFPASAAEMMEKSRMSTREVNLLTDGGVPADCDVLISYKPTADLADDELQLVREYLASGGKVIYLMAPDNTLVLPNFEALMAEHGMAPTDGLIADTKAYYGNTPYIFFPTLADSADIAGSLTAESLLLVDQSRGLTLARQAEGSALTAEPLLTTSDEGFNVTETTQTQGVYSVAAVAKNAENGSRFTVYAAASLIDPSITDAFTNLSNLTLFLNSVSVGFEEISNISIAPVSLEEPYNTVTTAGLWSLLFIAVIPLTLLICGSVRALRRRKL